MNKQKKKLTLKDFKLAVKNGMKVLHIDTENSLNISAHFGTRDVYISDDQIIIPSQTISFQWRWEHEHKAYYKDWKKIGVPDIRVGKSGYCSKEVLITAANIINKADIVIGQNLCGFDYKMLQAALKDNQLAPLDNDKTIDILSLSRKSFRQEHHSLNARAHRAFKEQKLRTNLEDWKNLSLQKTTVHSVMGPYGVKDVELGRRLFFHEFNYYKNLPSKIEKLIRSFIEPKRPFCIRCENRHRNKYKITIKTNDLGKKQYQCKQCQLTWSTKKLSK